MSTGGCISRLRCEELHQSKGDANWGRPCDPNTFWNWIAVGEEAALKQAKKRAKSAPVQILTTTGDDGTLILRNLEMKDRALLVSVNSKERTEQAQALFGHV